MQTLVIRLVVLILVITTRSTILLKNSFMFIGKHYQENLKFSSMVREHVTLLAALIVEWNVKFIICYCNLLLVRIIIKQMPFFVYVCHCLYIKGGLKTDFDFDKNCFASILKVQDGRNFDDKFVYIRGTNFNSS